MSAQNGHRFGHNFRSAYSAYFKILENTSFWAPSKNTRISYVTTMEATTFPHIVFSVSLCGTYIRMVFLSLNFQRGVSKLSRFRLSRLCEFIIFCSDLRLGWGFKQTYSPPWELSNCVLHSTCTHQGQVDSRLLVIDPFFCHNLCYKCSNG